ncbi:MAG TPA: DUF2117 domain-containing protein [Candidatus Deferrimicrobium sp.]|nr:DUF2117 domain-containing protein [Candidatus Deferrimicrobium sp.]
MRLIYALRKQRAIQLMRSTWLIESIEEDLGAILDECIYQGYPIHLTEWKPVSVSQKIHAQKDTLPELRIGIIIHSPEVTELGITKDFLTRVETVKMNYQAVLGGIMGRLAILDAILEEKVFIDHPYKPSEALDYLIIRNVDLIILMNQASTRESGIEFGRQVVENSNLLKFFKTLPLIQIDRLRDEDRFMIKWQHQCRLIEQWLQKNYKLEEISPPPAQESLKVAGDKVTRILRAIQINDKLLVNGVVIGAVTSDKVEVIAESGRITDLKGAEKNSHGIEKLGLVDLTAARITTLKSLRRVHKSKKRKVSSPKIKSHIAMLTWRGEQVYRHADKIDCLVSIGDDTTFVSTEILSRFSCPIIGIIDGDADGILYTETSLAQLEEIAPPNSLFIQVQPEQDDVVGQLIEKILFKNRIKIKYSTLEELKRKILAIAKEYLVEL